MPSASSRTQITIRGIMGKMQDRLLYIGTKAQTPQFLNNIMEDESHIELQLLPHSMMASSSSPDPSLKYHHHRPRSDAPSLDLQLSISLMSPLRQHQHDSFVPIPDSSGCIQALKWQAAEQIRLAALEKAYAERVRELTRREMELAQSEFARARHVWERAREDVERAERLKERATHRRIDDHAASCIMEITCHSCRQRFRP